MAEDNPVVLARSRGAVRTITLNRPQVLNAFNGELLAALGNAVRAAPMGTALAPV